MSSEAPDPSRRLYLPALDGVRAIAFLLVFGVHAGIHPAMQLPKEHPFRLAAFALAESGFFGVPLFYALSAFLVTHLLLIERERTGTVAVRDFLVRRSLRIWPLYYLVLLLAAASMVVGVRWPGVRPLNGPILAGFAFFFGDLATLKYGGTILGPLWSLSVEEKFYLIWPGSLRRMSVETLRRVAWGLVAFAFLVRALVTSRFAPLQFWFFPLNHVDSFAYGILLATIPIRRTPRGDGWIAFLVGGLVLAAALGRLAGDHSATPAVGYAVSMPIAAIVAAVFLLRVRGAEAGFLTWTPLRELGKRTYGAYVLHYLPCQIAVALVRDHLSLGYIVAQGIALTVTIALAWVSYRWIESPFLRLKTRFERVASRPV